MAALYDLRENPNPLKKDKPQGLHARIVSQGTVDTQTIIDEIAHATSFSTADLKGVLAALEDSVASHLSRGYRVELGNLGYFSAKLKVKPTTEKSQTHAQSVHFDNVNFRAASWLRKHLDGELVRAPHGIRYSKLTSQEEHKKLLDDYLDKHAFITRSDYSNLTGLLKNKALNELKSWAEQGILIKQGKLNQMFFTRPKLD